MYILDSFFKVEGVEVVEGVEELNTVEIVLSLRL
jgi:hypothetical protein